MRWTIARMTVNFANEILGWKYEPPYDFYNNEMTEEGMAELMDGQYVAILDDTNQLVGYYCTGSGAQVPAGIPLGVYKDEMLDIGLGLMPNLTGKGLGSSYFSYILHSINSSLPLRLTVATFNKRAIKLYKNAGFISNFKFYSNDKEFQTMIKDRI